WTGDPAMVPVWVSSCPGDELGFSTCSPEDVAAAPWAPDMGGRLLGSVVADVEPGSSTVTMELDAAALEPLRTDGAILVSWESAETGGVNAWHVAVVEGAVPTDEAPEAPTGEPTEEPTGEAADPGPADAPAAAAPADGAAPRGAHRGTRRGAHRGAAGGADRPGPDGHAHRPRPDRRGDPAPGLRRGRAAHHRCGRHDGAARGARPGAGRRRDDPRGPAA